MSMTRKKSQAMRHFPLLFILALFCTCTAQLLFSVHKLKNPVPCVLSAERENEFTAAASHYTPEMVCELNWNIRDFGIQKPHINAASALLIDSQTGGILYEKKADTLIPPASMTKLAVMYIAFQETAGGNISLEDIVPLGRGAWAKNAPPGSSLMFLDEGQHVSLRELLLGLAVVSGNDAAVAVADYIAGSQAVFVERMNAEMKKLGLRHTRFVDSSGYSENNLTTAREFAAFVRAYLRLYPNALHDFHSVRRFSYPAAHNVPHKHRGEYQTVTQENTNPVLGMIEGVTGLKTGFIPESGYNLALTAESERINVIAITLGGPGKGTAEGNAYRLKDAQTLTSYAFDNFQTVKPERAAHALAVAGGSEYALFAREARAPLITLPRKTVKLERTYTLPDYLFAPVQAGDTIGTAVYRADGVQVCEIPLIADRSIQKAHFIKRAVDKAASLFL